MRRATKIKGKISMRNLMVMLHSALDRENDSWKPARYAEDSTIPDDEVGCGERTGQVEWFLKINEQFRFNPETVVLCIAIFDHFMNVVKVKSKYTECIAVACYFLAVKTMEEDEVEKSKYLGVEFTDDGKLEVELNTGIAKACAVMRQLQRPVGRKAKLEIFRSVYMPTHLYGHEIWLMTEIIQSDEMSFLRRVVGLLLLDRGRSSDIREELQVGPLILQIERSQLQYFGHTIPTTLELVERAECSCSISDVLRMEKIILQKLNWNTKLVTSLDFLHIMHGLLVLNHGAVTSSPGRQLSSLTRKLHACLTSHRMLIFRPSTVALALLSLELQLCTRDWLALTIMMQHLIKLENGDLILCRELISETLAAKVQRQIEMGKPGSAKRYPSPINKPSKRKVEQIEVDDIYDSIKRLYGEEVPTTCSTQAVQSSVHSPGFLQVPAT